MGLFAWIIVGAIAGYFANMYMKTGEKDLVIKILQGMAGAAIGGFIAQFIGFGASGGVTIGNIIFATIGAVILIWALRKFRQGR